MHHNRPYTRAHYRVSFICPVMFSDQATIGEGTVTNLSVLGCTVECTTHVPEKGPVLVRLLLPDERQSLRIERAAVRWVKGNQIGLEFHQVERQANLRLHGFVWDRMVERLQAITLNVAR